MAMKTEGEFYTWDEDGVCDWLRTLIYEEDVVQLFKENAVNGELLPDLTDELLREEVGIKGGEMRNRILCHIQNLVEGIPPPPSVPQSKPLPHHKFLPPSNFPFAHNPPPLMNQKMQMYGQPQVQYPGAPPSGFVGAPPLPGAPALFPPPPPQSPPPSVPHTPRSKARRKREGYGHSPDNSKKPRVVFKCTIPGCPKEFHVEGWLRIHLEAHRLGKVTVMKCPLCPMTFVENERLRVHYEEHSNLRTISCDFCDRKFAERRHLERHLTTHADMKPFRCPVANCNAAFSTRGAIRDHRKSHPEMRTCHICHAVVSDERYLKTHVMGVHGAQRWPCRHPGCDKTYSTKQALALHARKHGEKRFHCDQCDKAFHYIRELKYHITKEHTEKKAFSCNYCNMSFDHTEDLNSHMRVHTGDMIPCPKCKMKFTKIEKLKLHIQIAHDSPDGKDYQVEESENEIDEAQEHDMIGPSFQCPGCQQQFVTTDALDNHIRAVHGEMVTTIVGDDDVKKYVPPGPPPGVPPMQQGGPHPPPPMQSIPMMSQQVGVYPYSFVPPLQQIPQPQNVQGQPHQQVNVSAYTQPALQTQPQHVPQHAPQHASQHAPQHVPPQLPPQGIVGQQAQYSQGLIKNGTSTQ